MHNDGKSSQFITPSKTLVLISIAVVLILSVSISMAIFAETEITVKDGENVFTVKARNLKVSEVLEENGILLGEHDEISCSQDTKIRDLSEEITIFRAKKLTVIVSGESKEEYVIANTVREALEKLSITVGEYDEISPSMDESITDGGTVTIARGELIQKTSLESIPYEKKKIENANIGKGHTRVKTKGVNGEKEITYQAVLVEGVEKSKEVISEKVIKQPQDEITEVGTRAPVISSRGASLRAKETLTVTATAYDGSAASNGKWAGRTATGMKPAVGVVAVDPKVIPLGTRLYIESADGGKSWVYGYAVAGDTGGAIKGNKVDLFFETRSETIQFGRRQATVYILE